MADQAADGHYREDDEPEPEEYDPGPEADDAGGMSEYRQRAGLRRAGERHDDAYLLPVLRRRSGPL